MAPLWRRLIYTIETALQQFEIQTLRTIETMRIKKKIGHLKTGADTNLISSLCLLPGVLVYVYARRWMSHLPPLSVSVFQSCHQVRLLFPLPFLCFDPFILQCALTLRAAWLCPEEWRVRVCNSRVKIVMITSAVYLFQSSSLVGPLSFWFAFFSGPHLKICLLKTEPREKAKQQTLYLPPKGRVNWLLSKSK